MEPAAAIYHSFAESFLWREFGGNMLAAIALVIIIFLGWIYLTDIINRKLFIRCFDLNAPSTAGLLAASLTASVVWILTTFS